MIICGPVRSNRQFEPCLAILKGEGFPSRILPPRDYCHTNLLSLLKLKESCTSSKLGTAKLIPLIVRPLNPINARSRKRQALTIGGLLSSLATSLIRSDYYTSDHSSQLAVNLQSPRFASSLRVFKITTIGTPFLPEFSLQTRNRSTVVIKLLRNCDFTMSTPSNKSVSTTAQPKQAPTTEPISASHPSKAPKKPAARVHKKAKKPISPEIIPSEWDTSSAEETKSDKPKAKSSTAPELKKSSTTADPFKSKKPIDQLIDKEVLKNIHIQKSTHALKAPVPQQAPSVISNQPNLAAVSTENRSVDPVVSKTAVEPEESKSTRPEKNFFAPSFPKISSDSTIQKKIENYFVPQGRTTRSISSASSILPSASFTTEPYEPADSSDLDVITGATAQLWSKPKTSKAPLADDILRRYRPSFHPLLQAVKLQQEYYRRALETNDEDQKIVALRAASTAQTDLLRVMNLEEFLTLFEKWNPVAEYQDYLTGQSGKDYWKKEGIPTTPSQAPEAVMRPPEENQEQPTINSSDQPPAAMNHPQGGYYYPPTNPQAQQPYWNQPSYPVTAQGYQYHPPANYHHPTSGQAHPASATGGPTTFQSNQNRNRRRNSNRRRNQSHRGPDWLPRPGPNRAPQNSNAESSREARRRSHQLSIHQEMIRLNRTTQAQFQALESMRDQNAG
ncbi:hypothetical protein PGTUg99_029136 [Puccinia graminis f. sp. tritici]|uniref:Uncharacterized protein n=1 Tax=Puccinia graminis f. sp. tritici TaxID=56615 RepID=A0A5B0Q3P8_PUCGR|nr:hypothetical protein PGTUg99_029136 [Puccinia graminis f. sp. tritici]